MRRVNIEKVALGLPRHVATFILAIAFSVSASLGILAYYSYISLRDAERERERIAEAMQYWIGIQAEIETLRLGIVAAEPDAGRRLPEQYAIFASRFGLLRAPELRETLAMSVIGRERVGTLDQVIGAFDRLDAQIKDQKLDFEVKRAAIHDFVIDWNQPISRLARTLFAVESNRTHAQTERVAQLQGQQLWLRVALAMGLLAFGALVYAFLRISAAMARTTAHQRGRLSHVVETLPIQVQLFDEGGRILMTNKATQARLEALGVGARDTRTATEYFEAIARTGQVSEAIGREKAWAQDQARLLLFGPERFTRRDELDGRIYLCHRTVNAYAEVLVASIDVTDLIQARDEAQALSAERVEFMAVLGHEMKTPVATLKAALDLASRSNDLHEIHRRLKLSRQSLDSLLTLAEDLFDYMSIEAGATRLKHSSFDLPAWVDALRRDYGPKAAAAGLAFSVTTRNIDGLWIRSDRVRLRQIADNLLTNALKYTPFGTVTLRVNLRGDSLEFTVEDTGLGVPEAERTRIFEPFVQSSRTSGRRGGIGLGLPICRRLAIALGGDLAHRDNPGGGSAFVLRVPVKRAEQEPALAPIPSPGTGQGWRRRVLLVEDNEMLAEVTLAQLKDLSYAADHAADVASALDHCARTRYDAVLLDLGLPDGSGLAVSRALASGRLASSEAFVAVLTAYVDARRREECEDAGADIVLCKPFEPLDFARRMARHFGEIAEAESATPTDDAARLDEARALLGPERLAAHLADLATSVSRIIDDPALTEPAPAPERLSRLQHRAHRAAGHARQLGLGRLADGLIGLETALAVGRATEASDRDALRAALVHAQASIETGK